VRAAMMLPRNQEPLLIEKLNNKIVFLCENNSKGVERGGFLSADPATRNLQEYLALRGDSRISRILKYVVLSSIARQYNLYDTKSEASQIRRLILDEMESLIVGDRVGKRNSEDLIFGVRIIQSHYPLLFQGNEQGLLSVEQASLEMSANIPAWEADMPIQPINIVPDRMFNFVDVQDIQTRLQTQIFDKNIVIPKKNLWISTSLLLSLLSGFLLVVVSNLYSNNHNYIDSTKISGKSIAQDSLVNSKQASTTPDVKFDNQSEMGRLNADIVHENEPISNPDILSQAESLNLVKRFLESKHQLFAPPFNKSLGFEMMTGKAYQEYTMGSNMDKSKEKSVEWLQKNGSYYHYGVPLIHSIKSFQTAGNAAVLEIEQIEEVALYSRKSVLYQEKPRVKEKIVRYSLVKKNGAVKIANYSTIMDKSIMDKSRSKI
jgi:ARC6-like, IMS domain